MKAGTLSESGRIRPHLTPLECGIIFGGIPAGAISRKGGLIWGIPANSTSILSNWWGPPQPACLQTLFPCLSVGHNRWYKHLGQVNQFMKVCASHAHDAGKLS